MKKAVYIPSAFRKFTGSGIVKIDGNTAGEVIENLARNYFPLRKHIFSDVGRIRSFINIYVNNEDIKLLQNENTVLNDNDVIKIIPTISGGI